MIFSDFAPNETSKDAVLALKFIFQPWRWRNGKEMHNLKRRLKSCFFSSDTQISLFMTGRAALYQYLSSLKLHTGDEVIVQAFTCEAVILPILALGLRPIYVDIHSSDFSMNIQDLEKKYIPHAKVIIIQHTFGITPKDRKQLLEFAKTHKLQVIEDIAHGFDPNLFRLKRYPGAVLLSFGRSKSFSSVFGGAIAIRGIKAGKALKETEKNLPNPSLWILIQILIYKISSVIIKATYTIQIGKGIHFMFKQFDLIMPEVTKQEKNGQFNNAFLRTFPNIAAICMLEQLDRFNDVVNKRKKVSAFFDSELHVKTARGLGLLRYPYLCKDPEQLQKKALKQHIQLGRWYCQVVAPKEINLMAVGYTTGSCPIAESVSKHVINFPTTISIADAESIIKVLK